MDLSTLVFRTETSDLERAGKALEGVVVSMSKLDKAAQTAARTEATLAKAAKDSAKASLDNAKAQQVNVKAVEATEQAQRKVAAATEKSNSILQRQNDIYDFMTQGFSKGQAGILASAKATGQLSGELKKVLDDMKAFETNPFDKSELGLKRLQKTMKEVVAAQGFFNEGSNLTTKQARELSNDLDRVGVALTKQGKSYQEVTQAQALHKQAFIEEAAAVNRAQNALDIVTKQRKEVVTATNYLTQADQKMVAALNTSNSALDRAGTDSLVKYESALRKSGLTQDVVTSKLATYKTQLAQVQAQEMKRAEMHLTRAASPQITDLAVSLYSGQAPLTVLLQQGGQLVDLLKLSGVEASKFGDILRTSFYSMIPAIKQVAIGIAGLVGGLFMDASKGLLNIIGNATGFNAAMEAVRRGIVSGGESNFKYIASLEKLNTALATVAAVGIAGLLAGMILLALEYKKIIQSEGELSKALATSGAAIGLTKTEAVAYAESMSSLGVGTLKAMSAITEFTKAGVKGGESLGLMTKSATDLERYAGVAISETAKEYKKLQDAPTKTLTDIAINTGFVSKETLNLVDSLEKQGEMVKAVQVASEAKRKSDDAITAEAKQNLSGIEALWGDIGDAVNAVKQEIYDLATSNAAVGAMRTVWETVAVAVSEVWFTIKGVGKEIGGIGAQIAAVLRGDFSGAASIGEQMKADAESAADAQRKFVSAILDRSSAEQKSFNQSKEQNSQYAKWRKENDQALTSAISKEEKYKAKQIEVQNAVLAGTVSQTEADKALAGWKKIIMGDSKPKKDPSENYYATLMREATNNTIAADNATKNLTKSEQKLLEIKSDPRFQKFTETQKASVDAAYAGSIASEKAAAATEKQNEADELKSKILGKASGLGKEYYKALEQIQKYNKEGVYSDNEVKQLTEALYKATPAYKENIKAVEELNAKLLEYKQKAMDAEAAISSDNKSLDHRLSLLGLTTEEQKDVTREYERQSKLSKVSLDLEKKKLQIQKDFADLPIKQWELELQAEKDAAEQRKVINREVAVQYAEDLDKEIRAIKDGITDSIVSAMFDGGKEGSKKLREVLESTLRKKVTIVVDAVVNTLVGSAVGSLLGGSASSGASLLSTAGNLSSLSNLGMGYGIGNTAGTLAANATGTGIDGLLATNGAFGTAGGVMGAIGTALPWIGGALAITSLFGNKKKASASLGGTQTSYDASGNVTNYNPYYDSLNGTTASADSIVKSMQDTYVAAAKALGITTAATTFAYAANTGKNGENPNFSLNAAAGGSSYAQSWTTLSDDAVQLAASRAVVAALKGSTLPVYLSGVFDDITASTATQEQITSALNGAQALATFHTALESLPFGKLADLSYSAMQKLIGFSGSLESLQTNISGYYTNFYSEEEQRLQLIKNINTAVGGGFDAASMSTESFRKVVEASMTDTSDSGLKLTATLLSVQGSMHELITSSTEAAKAIDDQAKEAAKIAAQALADKAKLSYDNADKALTNAMSSLQRAVAAQKKIYQAQADVAQSAVTEISSIFDALKDGIRTLYGQVDSKQASINGRSFIEQALATAKTTGYLPDSKELSNAISEATSDPTAYKSKAESDFAKLTLAGSMTELKALAGTQLTSAEQQLDYAKKQLEALDKTLDLAQLQIDASNGIDTSVKSVADAINQLALALQVKSIASAGISDGSKGYQTASTAYDDTIKTIATGGFTAENKSEWYNSMLSSGFDDASIRGMVEGAVGKQSNTDWDYLKKLSSFDVGTNYVPQDMVAQIHQGEAIVPRAYNPAAGGSSESNSAMAEKLQRVVDELAMLRAETRAVVSNTGKTARIMDDVTQGGDSLKTTTTV